MAGVSFDEFRQNSPENPDVIMYNRLSGSVPIRDDGMRLTDTATAGSTKSRNFNIPEPEPASVESTSMQWGIGDILINNSGKRIELRDIGNGELDWVEIN